MEITTVLLIVIPLVLFYAVTSIVAALYIGCYWFNSMVTGEAGDKDDPRLVKVLAWYCMPTVCAFALLLILRKIVERLTLRSSRDKGPGIYILYQIALTVGEFIIQLDSSSQTRLDLRVTKGKTTLIIQGGSTPLQVWTEEGLTYMAFQSQLPQEDELILQKLVCDLAGWGWIWPDIIEVLRRRVIEELGEDQVLLALEHLFNGAKKTTRMQRIPLIGSYLARGGQ